MIPVVTPTEMAAIDAAAPEPVDVLIDRAGRAVARAAAAMLGGTYGRTVVVIVGPGNNGADGRVAAAELERRGVRSLVVDALTAPRRLPACDLVVDAAFGTGARTGWVAPDVGETPVLAVDLPSGLDATTGVAAPGTLRAARTVTFAAGKPGLYLNDGPRHAGRVEVVDIGLDAGAAHIGVVEAADVRAWLPRRDRDAHKWSHAVRIVAGSPGYTGAAWLASAAAQRSGAGLVALSSPGIEGRAPVEVVDRRIAAFDWAEAVLADLHRFDVLAIGPGLGREHYTIESAVRLIRNAVVPIVVDGDGLFALSWNDAGTPEFLRERAVATVLTPHDGEFTTLTGSRPEADRIAAAHRVVAMSGSVVLLKGPTTIVAEPGGSTLLVTNGDRRLATAGTGDVLTGIIATFLAAGVRADRAAAAAAWIHAEAANSVRGDGLVASDVVAAIPDVVARCLA